MSAYRYVVFARGKQPTADEVRQLQQFAGALANQFAWGTCRSDGRLVIAFDAGAFDHVKASDAGFETLLAKWIARGCETADHLGFVKDAAALRPTVAVSHGASHSAPEEVAPRESLRDSTRDAAKKLMTHESVARSLLGVQHKLDRYAALQRFSAAAPYLLMAIAAATTLAFGLYIRSRLVNSGRERRQATIERMLDESSQGETSDASTVAQP